MHHLAIATNDLESMYNFYKELPGLELIQINRSTTSDNNNLVKTIDASDWKQNRIRSIWFSFIDNPLIIMIEKENYKKGSQALVFSLTALNLEKPIIQKIMDLEEIRSDFTIYFHDPDGNKLGYSSYPTRLADFGF